MSYRFKNALKASLEDADASAASADAADAVSEVVDAGEPAADAVAVTEVGEPQENVEEVQVLSDDQEAATVIDTTDSMEEAIAEQNEAEAEVAENVEQTEELEEAAEGLESIYNELKQIRKTGKTDRTTLRMANIAVESYTSRLGLNHSSVVSVESFNSQLSMEAIGETLKKIWDNIVKFLVRVKDAVWNFLKRIFTAAGRLKARAERLANIKLAGDAKNKTIKVKGLAKRVAVGSKVETNPKTGLEKLCELVYNSVHWDEEVGKRTTLLRKLIKDRVERGLDFEITLGDAKRLDLTDLGAPKGFSSLGTGDKWGFESPVMPGNVKFVGSVPMSSDGKIELNGRTFFFGAKISAEQVKADVSEDKEIPTLDVAAIREVGKAALDVVKAAAYAEKAADDSRKAAKNLTGWFKAGGVTHELRKQQMVYFSAYRRMDSIPGQLASKICAHAIRTAGAYVQIAEASAAQYKKAKGSNESYSEEGFKGAVLGGVLALIAGAPAAPFVASVVGGAMIQNYLKAREKERKLALKMGKEPPKSTAEVVGDVAKEFIRARNERIALEKKLTAKAKAADAAKAV